MTAPGRSLDLGRRKSDNLCDPHDLGCCQRQRQRPPGVRTESSSPYGAGRWSCLPPLAPPSPPFRACYHTWDRRDDERGVRPSLSMTWLASPDFPFWTLALVLLLLASWFFLAGLVRFAKLVSYGSFLPWPWNVLSRGWPASELKRRWLSRAGHLRFACQLVSPSATR